MPRIETETLAEHRDWRRNQLIDAAASIAMESGGAAITVAAVAQRAGLSRTSVYEYFGSGSELVADLVIDELSSFAETLNAAVADCTDATAEQKAVEKQIRKSLSREDYGHHWWHKRKKLYVAELTAKTMDDTSVLVALADKTYNAENTAADLRGLNEADRAKVWEKFNADEKYQREWYLGLLSAFRANKVYDSRSEPLFRRFEAAVKEMFPQ